MARDAERLHVPFTLTPEELKGQLLRLAEANQAQNATLRVAIVRNRGGLFEAPGITRDADLVAFTTGLTDWGEGARLSYRPHGRYGASPFAGIKYTSWAENLTLYETAHQQGFDEFILLNEHGQVSECTSANLFVIQEDQVWTPPLATSGCLPGITRALLLDEIRVPGLTIAERELMPAELEDGDGVFMTSSTRDLLPVAEIDRERLHRAPDRFEALRAAFLAHRKAYVEARLGEAIPA
jgi:branched-chain amino acid aminotransferase